MRQKLDCSRADIVNCVDDRDPWPPWLASDCGQIRNQRQQLGDIVFIRAGELHFQRHTSTIDDQVVLAAELPAISRVWAGFLDTTTSTPAILGKQR